MSKIIDDSLSRYNEEEEKLYNEMDDLTYEEVSVRLKELWKLIPYNIHLNPARLMGKVNDLFKDDPQYIEDKKRNTYHIDIKENLSEEQIKDIEYLRDSIIKGSKIPPKYFGIKKDGDS